MPNTKSAKKRLRQNEARRAQNRSERSTLRTQIRKVREAVTAGQIETAEQEFRTAAKFLDRAGARRLIHPNAASRTKSRLQKMIKSGKSSD
jgi:small subunit ribosomal protein S20